MNEKRTHIKESHCFAPGCTNGYRSSKEKVSFFKAPKDAGRLKIWRTAIPRSDRVLNSKCVLCEKHFAPEFIERFYKTIINGKEILTPRGTPLLTKDAYPTIFPNLPKYFTKTLPIKRSNRDNNIEIVKRIRIDDSHTTDEHITPSNSILFDSVDLPKYWVKINYESSKNIVTFAKWCHFSTETDQPDKKVVIESSKEGFQCNVTIRGVTQKPSQVFSSKDVENIINELDNSNVCKGLAKVGEFKSLKAKPNFVLGCDKVFRTKSCSGVISDTKSSCFTCRYERKLVINRSNRSKYKPCSKE